MRRQGGRSGGSGGSGGAGGPVGRVAGAAGAGLLMVCGRWPPVRRTSDLRIAARVASPLSNACAIGGDSISAAAFLGTAGMVLAYGADMLWLPIGAAAGYVVLLALVTAPLRRSGVYTLSDFAEWRLGSRRVRRVTSTCLCFTGWFYLLAQFQGAGLTVQTATGLPSWAGWAAVACCALVAVLYGSRRGSTVSQGYQFWVKLAAVAIPAVVMVAIWWFENSPDPTLSGRPAFTRPTEVVVATDTVVRVRSGIPVRVTGTVDGEPHVGDETTLTPGHHTVRAGSRLDFPAGAPVPHAQRLPVEDGPSWATPLGCDREHPLLSVYSLLATLMLGTMGLPHVAVRFYTATSGGAARRTAALIPALLSMFFVFPTLYGALGRLYTPELLMTGETDATTLLLTWRLLPGPAGDLLGLVLVGGAFVAFVSAACGIVVALASTVSQCLGPGRQSAGFRFGVIVAFAGPLALVGHLTPLGSVGITLTAFTVSACTVCPLLVLGIWWRGLTPVGAGAGLAVGGTLSIGAGLAQIIGGPGVGWTGALLAAPAPAVAPVTVLVMVLVSLATPSRVPALTDRQMARLHVPELARVAPVSQAAGLGRT